ncbi:MAG: hypothetical protein RJB66_675 [Pseudomonadota bacterium]
MTLPRVLNYLKYGIKVALMIEVLFCLGFPSIGYSQLKLKTVTLALSTEPPNLDAGRATDSESFFVLGHSMEGLTRYGKDGNTAPGVAERWTLTEQGVVFYLRADARWSDGQPVVAKDFVFSWRRALDPATASEYSFILYPIKNAELINQGKLPLEQLGAVAKDDRTLEVTFEKPCGYFLGLTAFATYFPIREDLVQRTKDRYASNPESMLFNGPFKLTTWVHGSSLRMERNPFYWNKKNVDVDVIDVPYITPDETARFNLFKTQKIDILGLNKENLSNAQREHFKLRKFTDGTVFYFSFNFREGHLTANKNLRKAIRSVFNANQYVSRIVGIPGTIPGTGLIPAWLNGVNGPFRKEFPLIAVKNDIAMGKQYLAAAMKELKLKSPPSLVWLTTDSPTATKEAEYMQNLLKTTLGIQLKVDKQIFKQRLAKMRAGDFDIVSAGWGPDYADPMTFVDLFTSWNGNNTGQWFNKDYDQHIRNALGTVDTQTRMGEMAKAEKIILEELPIIPTYERTIIYTHSDKIKGLVRRAVGSDPDLTNVKIAD